MTTKPLPWRYQQQIRRWAFLILFAATISGCASLKTQKEEKPVLPTSVSLEVLYATDRDVTGETEPKHYFGVSRGQMHYGVCRVALPVAPDRSPFADHTIWEVGYGKKPKKHGELINIRPLDAQTFFADLSNRIQNSPDESTLVYIHGFGRKFDRAMRTTATLAYLLRYQGVPILYSWPSSGSVTAYQAATTTVDWTVSHLMDFLEDIAAKTNRSTMHIVAHSLGNRALLMALAKLASKPEAFKNWRFGEIVLVAPDIDRAIFKRESKEVLGAIDSRVTLYVSAVDVPLRASSQINRYPRVGDAKNGPVIIDGIETIDASEVVSLITGHSYYRDSPEVLSDLHYLINNRAGADDRPTVIPAETSAGRYWKVIDTGLD